VRVRLLFNHYDEETGADYVLGLDVGEREIEQVKFLLINGVNVEFRVIDAYHLQIFD
jgi:hypothetical protein